MGKSKKQQEAKRIDAIYAQPTIYYINFKDVPLEKYTESLDLLFRDPDFNELMTKRNNLAKVASRLKQGSSEIQNLVKQIQKRDLELAYTMYSSVVLANVRSNVTFDLFSFGTLLRYFVDYSQDGMQEKVDTLSLNLDKVAFLSDMLECVVKDVRSNMYAVFGNTTEFHQFDGVLKMIQQLRGFYKSVVGENDNTPKAQLYFDYSDSIDDYLSKRLTTYSKRLRKLTPQLPVYSAEQMVEALNLFFYNETHFDKEFIKHTESGGTYIDALSLVKVLSPSQTERIDKVMKEAGCMVTADKDPANYCFSVTDIILLYYHRSKSKKVKR